MSLGIANVIREKRYLSNSTQVYRSSGNFIVEDFDKGFGYLQDTFRVQPRNPQSSQTKFPLLSAVQVGGLMLQYAYTEQWITTPYVQSLCCYLPHILDPLTTVVR